MLHSGATFAQAFAKINLTLDVLGKRPDGYHNLASVMQTIALHDTLSLQTTADGDLECVCDAETLNTPDNLVLRAAVLLRQEAHRPNLSAIIDLHKETPAQGGLGGGSSDAATTLIQLNAKWSLGISPARLGTGSATWLRCAVLPAWWHGAHRRAWRSCDTAARCRTALARAGQTGNRHPDACCVPCPAAG